MDLRESVSSIMRIAAGVTAVFYIFAEFFLMSYHFSYSSFILSLYLIIFAFFAIVTEFSPFLLLILLKYFPFLGEVKQKAVFYIVLGLVPLGNSWYSILAGLLFIALGIASLVLNHIGLLSNEGLIPNSSQSASYPTYSREDEGTEQYGNI